MAKCTVIHGTEWYYSVAHKGNREDGFQKHLVPPVFSDQSRPAPGSLTFQLTQKKSQFLKTDTDPVHYKCYSL